MLIVTKHLGLTIFWFTYINKELSNPTAPLRSPGNQWSSLTSCSGMGWMASIRDTVPWMPLTSSVRKQTMKQLHSSLSVIHIPLSVKKKKKKTDNEITIFLIFRDTHFFICMKTDNETTTFLIFCRTYFFKEVYFLHCALFFFFD